MNDDAKADAGQALVRYSENERTIWHAMRRLAAPRDAISELDAANWDPPTHGPLQPCDDICSALQHHDLLQDVRALKDALTERPYPVKEIESHGHGHLARQDR